MDTRAHCAYDRYMQGLQAHGARSLCPVGPTIFVVDDDETMRSGLMRLLRSAGWSVETFTSANEFLARVPMIGRGCVLLDVKMPGVSGLELHEQMKDAGIALPVVFLSGSGDIPMSVHAIQDGAIDFLVKPVEEDALFQALDRAIKRFDDEVIARHHHECSISRLNRLTVREREVLDLILKGRLNKQVAFDLGIAEKTVKVHRSRVMEKMEAQTIAELVHCWKCPAECKDASSSVPASTLVTFFSAPALMKNPAGIRWIGLKQQ